MLKHLIIQETLRLGQCRDINTGKRPLPSELPDLLAELEDLLSTLLALFLDGSDTDEVLEELAASLLLENKSELDGTVKEVSDDLDVVLEHVTRSESGGTETDTAGDLSGGVTRDSVL